MKFHGVILAVGAIIGCKASKSPSTTIKHIPIIPAMKPLSGSTYKSATVNTKGVALDTDGDGVPDYRDKELLTFSRCFPVDISGVGFCPEPACCKDDGGMIDEFSCLVGSIEIVFSQKSHILNAKARRVLDSVGNQLKANPNCKLLIGTVSSPAKGGVTLSWNRVNVIIQYLVKQADISQERFYFGYDIGEIDIVELKGTADNGLPPAPKPKAKLPQ